MFRYLAIVLVVIAVLVAAAPVSACNYGVGGGAVFSFSQPNYVQQQLVYSQPFVQPVYAQQFNVGYAQPFVQRQFVSQRVYSRPFVQRQVVRQRFVGGYGGGLNIRVGGW